MKTKKEILRERNILEEKLTLAEIEYNKVNYEKKTYRDEIKKIKKEIDNSSKENIEKIQTKIDRDEENLQKSISKLEEIKSRKYNDKNLKRSNLYGEKSKISKLNQKINSNKKLILKYQKFVVEKQEEKIENLNQKIEKITPDLLLKKEKVSSIKKEYKKIFFDWESNFSKEENSTSIIVKNLNIFYGEKQAIKNITINFPKNNVIAIIGPSGCGKSTFLRTLNRINDEIPNFRATGKILLNNEIDILTLKNIHNSNEKITLPELRTKIGMVFQQPNPFPMSIFNNVAYGPKINGIKNKSILKEIVDNSLKKAALFEQVRDNLNELATGLSGGQQQRLCIARAIANRPSVLLMDEPTSALDPIAASKVENLILELKKDYTIIMVTHSMQQAARISDWTAFFYQGELIEYDKTKKIFTKPLEKRTDDYIRGKFG